MNDSKLRVFGLCKSLIFSEIKSAKTFSAFVWKLPKNVR